MKIASLCLILALFVAGYANICGGNCPAGNCPSCPCGLTTVRIDLEMYCSTYSNWNQNCCKCISQRISGGSQNFYKYTNSLFFGGILGVGEAESLNLCNFHPWSWICFSWRDNGICANRIYTRDGSWKYWKEDAVACGCPVESEEERQAR